MTHLIKDQILQVRDDGRSNMFDVNGVMWVANDLNLFDLVCYLAEEKNHKEYVNFIFTGNAPMEDEDDETVDDSKAESGDDSDEAKPVHHLVIPHRDQSLNRPVDMNDPEAAATAVELVIPDSFSNRAKRVMRYLDGTAFLYQYKGHYVLTDESLYLTNHGDGTFEAPIGFPRWTGESLEDLETWLEAVADDYDKDGDIPGWEETE